MASKSVNTTLVLYQTAEGLQAFYVDPEKTKENINKINLFVYLTGYTLTIQTKVYCRMHHFGVFLYESWSIHNSIQRLHSLVLYKISFITFHKNKPSGVMSEDPRKVMTSMKNPQLPVMLNQARYNLTKIWRSFPMWKDHPQSCIQRKVAWQCVDQTPHYF